MESKDKISGGRRRKSKLKKLGQSFCKMLTQIGYCRWPSGPVYEDWNIYENRVELPLFAAKVESNFAKLLQK